MTSIDDLRRWLKDSQNTVAFTGAGISTESGIPDFRSPGGVWSRHAPIEFREFLASEEKRREYWRRKFIFDRDLRQAVPNAGHLALARLAQKGPLSVVITQNVDGLHQRSGVPEDRVIELHGNTTYAACLGCGQRYDLEPIREAFETDGILPVCNQCSGIVKPATVSFGQAMPPRAIQQAQAAALACDLFLAIGSSLVVYPAAAFPEIAKQSRARLIIINREPTPLDAIADRVIHAEIGPSLSAVVEAL